MEYYEEETGKKEETPVRKKKTRRRKYRGGDIMFLLIAIAVFSVIIAFVVSRSKEKNNKTSASEDMAENVITYSEADMKTISAMARAEGRTEGEERLKDRIRIELTEGGKSVNDVVRGLYPEYLIYMEGGNYHFTPVKENLEKNPYRNTAFSVSDDGVLKLMVDGEETSKQVIDSQYFVSSKQEENPLLHVPALSSHIAHQSVSQGTGPHHLHAQPFPYCASIILFRQSYVLLDFVFWADICKAIFVKHTSYMPFA